MKIYTLTLSPAYDVHATVGALALGRENHAQVLCRDAGGKGINISRALTYNGVSNTAVVVLGRENAAEFKASLNADGIRYLAIETDGRIRENLTLHPANGEETRVSFSGISLSNGILDEIEQLLSMDGDTLVTCTGSVPDGVGMKQIKAFLARLQSRGTKVVVDSRSFSLSDLIEVSPWLIKPNLEEISAYAGREIASASDCADLAKSLSCMGIEHVMISRGKDGAVLATSSTCLIAEPPHIQALSTIGAGDSTIAGFISAYGRGGDLTECLRTAVSFGSAACLLPGTTPPTPQNVNQIYPLVKIDCVG